jgi:Zinc finger, C3HC4 type (RING finger)
MVIIQIGSHTFHLHEIYGLSSTSTQSTVPAVNPTAYTYPPTAATPAEDEPSSECLVCLSSPREVVLLPCRHLVACKECAINMVEFGAGGAIMHAEEPTTNLGPQPTETAEAPAVDDSGSPAVASRPAEDSPALGAVPENGEGIADSSAVEPSQVAAQPTRNEDQVASSASATPGSTPQVPPFGPVPQNPRRKRRAKGWTCPVCRQREYPSLFYAPK